MTLDLIRKQSKEKTSSELEATTSELGTVRRNRSQTKVLTSNIANPLVSTTFLVFNGLTIGKRYKLIGQLYQAGITTGNNSRIELLGQTLDSGNSCFFDLYGITGMEIQTPVNVEFTASTTSVGFNVYSAYTGLIAGLTGGRDRSWATLTELNNVDLTSDFT